MGFYVDPNGHEFPIATLHEAFKISEFFKIPLTITRQEFGRRGGIVKY